MSDEQRRPSVRSQLDSETAGPVGAILLVHHRARETGAPVDVRKAFQDWNAANPPA